MTTTPLTLVSVVFEPELPLLALQARSLRLHVPVEQFAKVIVIDNTWRGLSARARSRLMGEYGPWRERVSFVRPADISPLPASRGWVSQQVLKLLVHEQVGTPCYLVLDAKNHWVRPTAAETFVAPDGRPRGACHGYREHPLRSSLVRVLEYLDVDPEPWLDGFPATHTPVVLSTDLVRRLTTELAERAGRPFAEEFVAAQLTEFFLYSGWIIATFGGLEGHLDGTVIRSANVWPGRSSAADFARALSEAETNEAPFLSVHRTALARADRTASVALADFWVTHGLMPDRRRALAFLAAFQLRYLRTMSVRKARTSLTAGHDRLRSSRFGRGDSAGSL